MNARRTLFNLICFACTPLFTFSADLPAPAEPPMVKGFDPHRASTSAEAVARNAIETSYDVVIFRLRGNGDEENARALQLQRDEHLADVNFVAKCTVAVRERLGEPEPNGADALRRSVVQSKLSSDLETTRRELSMPEGGQAFHWPLRPWPLGAPTTESVPPHLLLAKQLVQKRIEIVAGRLRANGEPDAAKRAMERLPQVEEDKTLIEVYAGAIAGTLGTDPDSKEVDALREKVQKFSTTEDLSKAREIFGAADTQKVKWFELPWPLPGPTTTRPVSPK